MGNHRSFHDEQELLLMPVYAKDREVLPVAAIYGANASGKSNLLDGLKFMADAVRDSFAQWRPGGGVPRRPFKLDPAAREQPSIFVAEIVEGGVRYTYGFEVDDERVLSEWLYSYPEKRKRVLFDRSRDHVKFGKTVTDATFKMEVLEELLRPNALFISLAAQSNVAALVPVYQWFTRRLSFRLDGEPSNLEAGVAHFLREYRSLHDQLVELLSVADFGISDIGLNPEAGLDLLVDRYKVEAGHNQRLLVGLRERLATIEGQRAGRHRSDQLDDERRAIHHEITHVQERYFDSRNRLDQLEREVERGRHQVRLSHGRGSELFRLDEESAGTRSWLGLLPAVLLVLREGGVLVIDEIDASLHSLLSARLVALFNDPETNVADGQLIFTTHDATLLHPPLADEVLDRDEVWFVEKDQKGASTLHPLSDFKPRREDNLERRYLAGQYGGVPHVYEEHFVNAVRDGVADGRA
ncbi:AAA family ATPase [Saccharothrix deserti]|uniref:AAA family ATPase n=1 Tax=Saccharothrix deserti TaxID=2593674 RepID=UPI00131DE692|nr:ATP-binding protein [Saccharothrix deserti]